VRREARATATVTRGVRVLPLEPVAHESGLPVELAAREERRAPIVHEDTQSVEVEHQVALPALRGDVVDVVVTAAAAALHAEPETEHELRGVFLCLHEALLPHLDRALGEANRWIAGRELEGGPESRLRGRRGGRRGR